MVGWTDEWINGWMDGWINTWMNGWMDVHVASVYKLQI